jgi:hypothetical protein
MDLPISVISGENLTLSAATIGYMTLIVFV